MTDASQSISITGAMKPGYDEILSPEALAFVADLVRTFRPRVHELLAARKVEQARINAGGSLDFLPETQEIRDSDWTVAPLPQDLLDRRVEITGPVDRKMIINALNSGANVFMADFEDSNSPTWANCIEGQINLRDANRGTITFEHPTKGTYELNDEIAVLMVRPRGWHLVEKHIQVDGEHAIGGLVDFGLYFFHNARLRMGNGSGPYFYLPKLQHHLEARLWNDVFVHAQNALGIPVGTIKATMLLETLPAAFQMNELLWELKDHSAGLNCGRWDYIFSFIKTFATRADRVLPDRGDVGMTQPFMEAYTSLVIKTCHRREVHAMGGMAAQIPINHDAEANTVALDKVRNDKLREVTAGHDGTWVAHPGLVPLARAVFDEYMKTPHQIARKRLDVDVSASDLLSMPTGTITEAGLRQNINVGMLYMEAWMRGNGCVPLYNLMEDTATTEISRSQVWQWVHHGATLQDGTKIDAALVHDVVEEELKRIADMVGAEAFAKGEFKRASVLFNKISVADHLHEFLTLPSYELLIDPTLGVEAIDGLLQP